MQNLMQKYLVVAAASGALLLQACASTSGNSGAGTADRGVFSGNMGNAAAAALGALGGALAGVAISKGTGGEKTGRDAAIGAAIGAVGGFIWNQKMEEQRIAMEKATAGTGISVAKTVNNELKMEVPADAGFAIGQATIQPRLQSVLNTFAHTLRANGSTQVSIIGHTDSTGSDAINEPLSINRANSTRDYLVRNGVSASRFTTAGMGSRQPIATNNTDAGRAANRRVEIYVVQAAG